MRIFGFRLIRESDLEAMQASSDAALAAARDARNQIQTLQGSVRTLTQQKESAEAVVKNQQATLDDQQKLIDADARDAEKLDVLKQSIRIGPLDELKTVAIALDSAWAERRNNPKMAPKQRTENNQALEDGINKLGAIYDELAELAGPPRI